MTVVVLLDPWLFSGPKDDRDGLAQIESLTEFFESLVPDHPDLVLGRFLDAQEFYESLYGEDAEDAWKRLEARGLFSDWAAQVVLHAPLECAPATLNPPGPSDLGEAWLRAVAHYFSIEKRLWRDPIVAVGKSRLDDWPSCDEIEITTDHGSGSRVIVCIESRHDHRHYDSDLDPWILGNNRRLPRPPLTIGVPMAGWTHVLRHPDHGYSDRRSELFFMPARSWDPAALNKTEWRNGPLGETCRTGNNYGLKDRVGRIWCWDKLHKNQWDAEEEGGTNINVLPDGTIV